VPRLLQQSLFASATCRGHNLLTTTCDTRIFLLSCIGDHAKCQRPYPYFHDREILATYAVQRSGQGGFHDSYREEPARIQIFKYYYTTPDCTQTSRRESAKPFQHCPRVCTFCHGKSSTIFPRKNDTTRNGPQDGVNKRYLDQKNDAVEGYEEYTK